MQSCSGDGEEETNPFYFFDQTIVGPTPYAALLYTPRLLFTPEWYSDSALIRENLDDWVAHAESKPALAEVERLVYNSDLRFLAHARRFVTNAGDTLSDSLRQVLQANAWIQEWKARRQVSVLDYLLYAKACEPCVTEDAQEWTWSEGKGNFERLRPDLLPVMDSLILVGLRRLQKEESEFLKLRYGYQLVRLAHYAGQYARCIGLYDSLVAPLGVRSPIALWALANKAGAQRALGMEAEAAHNFAVVFAHDEGRRFSCFQSFRIRSDSIWQQCLGLCRNTGETVMLYFLRAIRPQSNALTEMREISALDPSSGLLDLLLVREIAKLEEEMVGVPPDYPPPYRREQRDSSLAYLARLNQFIAASVTEGRVGKPEVWKLAEGYTDYMLGRADQARAVFAELRKASSNERIQSQIRVFELATSIAQVTRVDRSVEDTLFRNVWAAGQGYLETYFLNRMAPVYDRQGDSLKGFLCRYPLTTVEYYPTMQQIDGFLALAGKRNKTPCESYLLHLGAGARSAYLPYWQTSPFGSGRDPLFYLKEIKGTLLLADDRLREAIALYKQLPGGFLARLRADPFTDRIKDCRDCDFERAPEQEYNKLTLAERLLELKKKITTRPDSAAQYQYLLGNAYYNMTHFGNSSEAIDYDRNPEYPMSNYAYYGSDTHPDIEYVDCSRALEHYQAAMKFAEAKGDRELAARCCFLAAKCEQNAFYTSAHRDARTAVEDSLYRSHFRTLMKSFSTTQYYREALTECKYFNEFVRRH